MTKNNITFNLIILFLCSLSLISCSTTQLKRYTTVKQPVIKFKKYQVISVSDKQIKLDILFDANNPNDIAIDSFYLSYELYVNKQSFIKGRRVKLKLIPKGTSIITLPIDIAYKKLLSNVSSVANRIVKGKNSIPMSVDIEIMGKFKVLEFVEHDYRYQKNIDMTIALPKYSMKDVMQFIQGIR